MKKILILKVVSCDHEDSYSYEIAGIPVTNEWIEVSENDYWLLRKYLDRGFRIVEDETFRVQEFLADAKEKEKAEQERQTKAEEKRKKAAEKSKEKLLEKKRKKLESLKRELGE